MVVYLTGVSKWDYQKWEQAGKPYLDQAGWATLCMAVCQTDIPNLEKLFVISEKLSKRLIGEARGEALGEARFIPWRRGPSCIRELEVQSVDLQ